MFFSRYLLSALATSSVVFAAPLAPILDVVGDILADNFIVVLRPQPESDFIEWLAGRSQELIAVTDTVFNIGDFQGFSGTLTDTLLEVVKNLALVKYIEPVTKVQASALISQANVPWGLSRISHRNRGFTNYVYDDSAGAGTYAYIIDTGIYTGHSDFEGRATFGANFAGDGSNDDGNGHGTHVAGTVGSKTYGVAKKTNLIAVKVLNAQGSGTSIGVISGIQWAVTDAKNKGRIGKAVGNLSLGGGFSQASNDAVAAAVRQGFFLGLAAGNEGSNARLYSPGSEPLGCTVGASTKTDGVASYSNYGSLVDVFAPGSDVLSTWIGGPSNSATLSGTSMATPHVVGLAAYLLNLEGTRAPGPLCDRIRSLSSTARLSLSLVHALAGTPNLLAYNGNGA